MCRNIKTLHNFAPPATEEEMRASALQYVRKLSGTRQPSKANQEAFDTAVEAIHAATQTLLLSLVTGAKPRTREEERAKAKRRGQRRDEALTRRYAEAGDPPLR